MHHRVTAAFCNVTLNISAHCVPMHHLIMMMCCWCMGTLCVYSAQRRHNNMNISQCNVIPYTQTSQEPQSYIKSSTTLFKAIVLCLFLKKELTTMKQSFCNPWLKCAFEKLRFGAPCSPNTWTYSGKNGDTLH